MVADLVLRILQLICDIFVAILPDASFWPLPSGFTSGLEFVGGKIALAAAILPAGTLENLTAALSLVVVANIFVLPWLAARNFRLPFAAINKG